jgi:hypothetical protein
MDADSMWMAPCYHPGGMESNLLPCRRSASTCTRYSGGSHERVSDSASDACRSHAGHISSTHSLHI